MSLEVLVVCGTGEPPKSPNRSTCTPLKKTRELIKRITNDNDVTKVNFLFMDIEEKNGSNFISFDFLMSQIQSINIYQRFDIIVLEHCPLGLITDRGIVYDENVLFYNIHFCLKPYGALLMPMKTFEKNFEPNFGHLLESFIKIPEPVKISELYSWQLLIRTNINTLQQGGKLKRKPKLKPKRKPSKG